MFPLKDVELRRNLVLVVLNVSVASPVCHRVGSGHVYMSTSSLLLLSVNITMHALPKVFAAPSPPSSRWLPSPPATSLRHLFWLASTRFPPPSSSCVLSTVQPPSSFVCLRPALSIVPTVPPISALVLPSDPSVLTSPAPPPLLMGGTPKSSCSSLDCSPFKFFFFFFPFWGG